MNAKTNKSAIHLLILMKLRSIKHTKQIGEYIVQFFFHVKYKTIYFLSYNLFNGKELELNLSIQVYIATRRKQQKQLNEKLND